MKLELLGWMFTAAIAAALPVIFIKQYIHDELPQYWLALPLLSYSILVYAYLQILRDYQMSILYPILKIVSILLVVGTGIFAQKEKLTPINSLGIILGIIAILLLSYNQDTK